MVLAPLDLRIYSIAGTPVGGREFVAGVGWAFGPAVIAAGVVTYGLVRNRAWSRPAMLGFWPIIALYAALDASHGPGGAAMAMIQGGSVLIAGVVAGIYLYRNRAAATYFESLDETTDRGTR